MGDFYCFTNDMRRRTSNYDFETKMRLNVFVIGEIVNALHPGTKGDDLRRAQNDVSGKLLESDEVHRLVGELATAIKVETDRQKRSSVASRVASRWIHG